MKTKKLKKDGLWAIFFLAPAVIGLCAFTIYPLVESLHISFTSWDLFSDKIFVGLKNFIDLFHDPTGLKVFRNTVVFTLLAVPIQIVISFFLAVALNQKIRGIRFFRGAYFLPAIASMVSISIVWQWLFNTDFGIVNYVIKLFGGAGVPWLTSTKYSLWTIIIVSCWKGMGYNMMIFLAGLQGVPSTYYEAAEMDGCTGLSRLVKIVIPLIKPTTLYVSITCVINSMQVFDQVMIITGGGPARSSSVLVQYLYENAFDYYKMGYASAIGWVMAIFIFILSVIQFKAMSNDDYSIE